MFHQPVEGGAFVGLECSVRVHVDPSVQAAGEHHPTDLKTGRVRSKSAAQSPWKTAGSLNAIDCGVGEGLEVMGLEGKSM